jgi:hypothetical protein
MPISDQSRCSAAHNTQFRARRSSRILSLAFLDPGCRQARSTPPHSGIEVLLAACESELHIVQNACNMHVLVSRRALGTEAMAKSAVSELQQQIEEVRCEAFAAGYAAAMQGVRELASRPAPASGSTASRGTGPRGAARPNRAAAPTLRRRPGASPGARPLRTRSKRPQRGSNAERIQEILEGATPRALRQAEIRQAMSDKGVEISFTSVRQALRQLEARNAADQVGDSKTWRHRGGTS